MSFRRKAAVVVQFCVSIALIWWVVGQIDLDAARARVVDASWLVLGMVFALMLVQVLVVSRRWQRVNACLDSPAGYGWHVRVMLVSLFFSQLLPSIVGGDAYRIWGVARHGGHGWRAGFLSVICDRAIGLGGHLIVMVAALPVLAALIGTGEAFWAIALAGTGGLVVGGFIVAYGRVPFWLSFAKLAEVLMAPAVQLKSILSRREEFIAQIGLSCVIQLLTVFAFWLLAAAFSLPLTMLEALAVVPPVILLSILPISVAGWGVREGAMLAAFHMLGHSSSDALVLSLGFGLLNLAVGLTGGAVWGIFQGQSRKNLR